MNSAWVLLAPVRGHTGRLPLWGSFALGASVGGALTGAAVGVLAGLVSPVPPAVRWLVAGILVVALVVTDLLQPTLRLPQRHELIPQDVFDRGLFRGILRFGLEYGTGVRTLIPSAASYVVAVVLLAANLPWVLVVAIGATFGFSRTVAVLQFVLLGEDGWQGFLAPHTRVLERLGTVVTATALGIAALGITP
jgi:hypothetical protein